MSNVHSSKSSCKWASPFSLPTCDVMWLAYLDSAISNRVHELRVFQAKSLLFCFPILFQLTWVCKIPIFLFYHCHVFFSFVLTFFYIFATHNLYILICLYRGRLSLCNTHTTHGWTWCLISIYISFSVLSPSTCDLSIFLILFLLLLFEFFLSFF